jgi:iron complex transport system substrate-binding protein
MRDRRWLGVLAAVVLVAACGGDDDNTAAPGATASDPAPDATTASVPPATVPPETPAPNTAADDGAVATTAPASDDRVVVLAEEFMLADVMALGIRPIASTASVPEVGFQGLDDVDTSGIEVLPMRTLSLEHLATLEPDTIITLQFWIDEIGADLLGGIGDVIAVPDGLTIPERLTFLGEQLDRREEAAGVIAELDAVTAAAAEAMPDDCVVSLAAIYPGPSPAAFVAGPWELPTSILSTGCALDPDPSVAAPDENGRVYLSLEQLGLLDAPTLVLLQSATVEGEMDAVDEMAANPLWATLPAVQSGDVLTFDRLGYPGAWGQMRFLQEFAGAMS